MDANLGSDRLDNQREEQRNYAFSRELIDKGSELSGAMALQSVCSVALRGRWEGLPRESP